VTFVRKKVKSFKWPVTVEEPADGGVFDSSTFDITFKRLGRKEFSKLSEKGDLPLLKAIVLDWDGIDDETASATGEVTPLPFSVTALTEFADDPYWVRAVLKAYTETFDGARQGN
jgi:hypothetical protein